MGAALALLVVGAVLYPRPPVDVSPRYLVARAIAVNKESPRAPIRHIQQDLREGCIPTLEGSDVISARPVWAVRLKIAPPRNPNDHPKRYPWLELWIDKKTSEILAWKEWGHRDGRVVTLAQSPNP